MARKRIAAHPEVQTERFARISHAKRFAVVNGVLTAFEFVVGCWHPKVSRPFTLSGWTYEVCLTCGKKFAYNRVEIGFRVPRKASDARRTSWPGSHESFSSPKPAESGFQTDDSGRGYEPVWTFSRAMVIVRVSTVPQCAHSHTDARTTVSHNISQSTYRHSGSAADSR